MSSYASPMKGLIAGAIAGAAGTAAMSLFQRFIMRRRTGAAADHHQARGHPANRKGEPPTSRAGTKLVEELTGHSLTRRQKRIADPIFHYALGITAGAAYGVASELAPKTTRGRGAPFGAAVWALADELAVPALGLSKPPWKSPLRGHVESFVAHLVYGVAAELARRIMVRGRARLAA